MISTIYKIVTDARDGTDRFKVYIGSTLRPFHKRIKQHEYALKRYLNGYKGISSTEIMKEDHYEIIILKQYPYEGENELRKTEGKYISQYSADPDYIVVNKQRAGLTEDDYKLYCQEYRQKNKEKLREQRRLKSISQLYGCYIQNYYDIINNP